MTLSQVTLQELINERKQRWVKLYDPANAGARVFMIRWMPELPERPWPHLENSHDRVEWSWKKYQLQLEQMEWLDDDTLPFLDLYTGTEIFASAFGCKVYYPENDMPFAMPLIDSAEQVKNVPEPDFDTPAIRVLFEMADELKRRAPQALMHMVDLQSPMDISALIWNKVTFYPALIQEPEAVQTLAHKVQAFMVRFLDEWFRRYGKEFISHFPDYYMPYGITLSEDEVGAVSGKMFNQLFLPELVALSDHFGAMGVHCCAHARHQWSNFLKIPNLVLLNLVQPDDITRDAWEFFAGRVAQWHNYQGEGSALTWKAQHPAQARMVYEITVDSKSEALEMAEKMRELVRSG